MDEPQITNTMDVSDTEKTNFDDVLDDASVSNENVKQMEVDETESFPSTSSAPVIFNEASEKLEDPEESNQQPEIEEAGSENDNQNEDSTMQQQQTDQDPALDQSNFDETFQSKQSESEDYTEKSINISQISVDQNDDSNDAFDALKLSESNVLEQTKDTIEDENVSNEIEPENEGSENNENIGSENNENEPENENVDNLNIEKGKEEETETAGQDLENPENDDDDDDFRSAGDGEQEQIDQDQESESGSKDQETAMDTDQQVPESGENLDQIDQNEASEVIDEQTETTEESHSADAATEMSSGELGGDDSGTAENSERVEEPEEGKLIYNSVQNEHYINKNLNFFWKKQQKRQMKEKGLMKMSVCLEMLKGN